MSKGLLERAIEAVKGHEKEMKDAADTGDTHPRGARHKDFVHHDDAKAEAEKERKRASKSVQDWIESGR